jgi:hypothetical protein
VKTPQGFSPQTATATTPRPLKTEQEEYFMEQSPLSPPPLPPNPDAAKVPAITVGWIRIL